MLVYSDLVSGDELFSDSYPIKLVDDLYYEVEGKNIKLDVDIDEALIGGNKATEPSEEDESVESTAITGINVVLTHKLQETGFTKDTFKSWLKDYMKMLLEKISSKKSEDEIKAWKGKMQLWAKDTLSKFDDYRWYTGEKMNPEAMVVASGYREDQITPYFMFFKDGLKEEKF